MTVESLTHMTNLVRALLYKHVLNVLMDFLHEFFFVRTRDVYAMCSRLFNDALA